MLIINLFILFSLIIVVVLVTSLVISFYYENRRQRSFQEKLSFHKQHNLFREEFDEKLLTMTLDDYIEYRKYHFSEIATLAFEISDMYSNDLEKESFGLKAEYYWDCKKTWNNTKLIL